MITGASDAELKSKPLLDNLREFQQKKGLVTAKDNLAGRAAIQFRLEESGRTTTLWVDAATKLPLQLMDEFMDPAPNIAHNRFVITAFAWDPAAVNAEELFSTKPPEGYTVTQEDRGAAKQ